MRILMCVLAATLAVGCKDKTTPNQAGNGSAAAGSGSASAAGSGSAVAQGSGSAVQQGTVLVLPKLEGDEKGKPPHQTTKPLDQATYDKLAKQFIFVGFKQEVREIAETGVDIRYVTDTRPRLAIVVKMWRCEGATGDRACEAPTLAVWTPKKTGLQMDMKGGLADESSTVVDIGQQDLGGGAKGIYTYQLGYNLGKEEKGAGAYADVYKIHWNDGINRISVGAEYKDDPAASMKDMENLAPRQDLEKLARAFFDVYTHAWE